MRTQGQRRSSKDSPARLAGRPTTWLQAPNDTSAAHGQAGWDGRQLAADVLDAWFDPSPEAISAYGHGAVGMRRSPDLESRELLAALEDVRGLDRTCVTLGAGSSELIHRVLPKVVGAGPAILLDPSYSEYGFVLQHLGIEIRRFALDPCTSFKVNIGALADACRSATLVVLVNPNNPTGASLGSDDVRELRSRLSPGAVLWVDEAYVDYAPPGTSIETWACREPGILVLRSLSKAYALSGVRAAYLVGEPRFTASLRPSTPPWIVGTAAQAAAAAALRHEAYYRAKWSETSTRVRHLAQALARLGLEVHAGCIPCVLVRAPQGMTASSWRDAFSLLGVAVRTPEGMGDVLGERFIRVSVVPENEMHRLLAATASSLALDH